MFVKQTHILLFVVVLSLGVLIAPTLRAQDDDSSIVPAQFNGHTFDIPRSLADGFSAFVIDEPSAYPDGADSIQPPRTEFRLLPYTDTASGAIPAAWVNIYTVSGLESYPEYQQYKQLHDLLSNRPDLNTQEALPTLYPNQISALSPDNYTGFFVNAAYLDSDAYNGITFIYGRVIHLGNRQPILFYRVYFEGISTDSERYVSAQVEGLQEFTEILEGVTNVEDYITQVKAMFHEPIDADIIAWLGQANVLFSSFDYVAQS